MSEYIHGFSRKEQEQLVQRAEAFESILYPGVELEDCKHLLEVGCGTGAQTKILLRRFPKLKITGVDYSKEQLAFAKHYLKSEISLGRVILLHGDAQKLQLGKKFDAAFLCWFLEHVPNPQEVLRRVHLHLKPRAKIYLTEVLNLLFLNPYSPANLEYWAQLNDLQWSIKGHPFVGAELGNLLTQARYKEIRTEMRSVHLDSRNSSRKDHILRLIENLALTTAPQLLREQRVTPQVVEKMKKELALVRKSKNGVLLYPFLRAVAQV